MYCTLFVEHLNEFDDIATRQTPGIAVFVVCLFQKQPFGKFRFSSVKLRSMVFPQFRPQRPKSMVFPTHFLVFTLSLGLLQESEDCWRRENLSAAISTCSLQLSQFSF